MIVEPGLRPLTIRELRSTARAKGGEFMLHADDGSRHRASTVFGHPRGLVYLVITEAWERFSFYGMSALLGLYLLNSLLLPGHAGRVMGLQSLRAGLTALSGPLSAQGFASRLFGLYSGLVFLTPVLGGMIADRWLGQRRAVVLGVLTMAAGHVAMIFEPLFLLALLLLVIGAGFLKGNIAAQVGALYPPTAEARRARGFVLFSTGINVGAVFGPVVCGFLAQSFGWHYGFAAAAVLMIPALGTYLYGYRYLPARIARDARTDEVMGRRDWRTVAALLVVMVIVTLPGIAYYQRANVFPVWIQDHVDVAVGAYHVPIAWFQSIDSLVSILAVPVLFSIWRRRAERGREAGDLGKIAWGSGVIAISNLMLAGAVSQSGSGRVGPIGPVLYCIGTGIGLIYYWPTALSLVSQAAPARVNATMLSITYLSIFLANLLAGWIGSFYERMAPRPFWALHALIAASGGVAALALRSPLARTLSVRGTAGPRLS